MKTANNNPELPKKDIRDFFNDASEFLNLLQPLLTALSWQGSFRNLIEALPEQNKSLGLPELIAVLKNLNFINYQVKKPLAKMDPTLTPFMYVPTHGPAMLVLELNSKTATIVNSITQRQDNIATARLKGTAYIFTYQPKTNTNHLDNNSNTWFKNNLNKFWPLLIQMVLISMLLSIFAIAPPIFVMTVFDKVLSSKSIPMLMSFSTGAAIVLISSIFLHKNRTKLIAILGINIEQLTTKLIFNKLLHLPPKYTETATVGAQLSRIKDFETIKDFLNNPNTTTIFELPAIVVGLAAIFILNKNLFLITLCAVIMFTGVYFALSLWYKRFNQKYAIANHYHQAFQTEALTNLHTIKAYASENTWCNRYKTMFSTATMHGFFANFFATSSNIIAESMLLLTCTLLAWQGTIAVLQQQLSTGTLFAILMLTWRVLNPIKTIFSLIPQLAQVKTSISQVDKLLTLATEQSKFSNSPAESPTSWAKSIASSLEFNKVCFNYQQTSLPALTNITLTVRANEVVCITGRNGSGKSTLLKLAHNMYQPQQGCIKLDGVNIQQLEPILYRQTVGYLSQTPQLFDTTIEQNLLLANPMANLETMIMATQLADLYTDIIQLPLQFKTSITSSEHNLLASSSFKQRLGLARIFIRQAPLYLFDEPTNALSNEHLQAFIRAIDFLRGCATILIATHHQQLLKIADRVVYLENSELVDVQTQKLMQEVIS